MNRPPEMFEDKKFENLQAFDGLREASFDQCLFSGCDLTERDCSQVLFVDCVFQRCNLTLARLAGARLQNVSFKECKIAGVDFTAVNPLILKIDFAQCLITGCNFSSLKLKGCDFSGCQVYHCDFYGTDLRQCLFEGTDLKGSLFYSTDLREAHLEDAQNYHINPVNNRVKQAVFSFPEAAALLDEFEVKLI